MAARNGQADAFATRPLLKDQRTKFRLGPRSENDPTRTFRQLEPLMRKRLRSARMRRNSKTTPDTDWAALTAAVVSDRQAVISGLAISSRLSLRNMKIFAKLNRAASLNGIGCPAHNGTCVKIAMPAAKTPPSQSSGLLKLFP